MMNKGDIYNSFDSIVPSDEQKSKMLNNILRQKKGFTTVITSSKKRKILIGAIIICLMTTTVIATNIPSFLFLLEKLNPNMVEFIEPIEEISIDQGIKMEVVAVGRYDNMIKAYITIQDLTGNRVGKDITFFDYFSIDGATGQSWSIIDYDDEKRKATILVTADNNIKFEGENLTFKINNIFYDNRKYENCKIKVDLGRLDTNTSYINSTTEQFLSWSEGNLYNDLLDNDIVPILEPNMKDIKFLEVKTSMISNIGIINENLHVQVWHDKNFKGQGLNIYLKDSNGEKIYSDSIFNFGIDESSKPTNYTDYPSYTEYIFDIDTNKLNEYELFGDFTSSKQIEGNWQVTFKAVDGAILDIPCNIDFTNGRIESISITPFGINLSGIMHNGAELSRLHMDIKIGTETEVIQASHSSSVLKVRDFFLIYEMEDPIDINLIKYIIVNGEKLIIKK